MKKLINERQHLLVDLGAASATMIVLTCRRKGLHTYRQQWRRGYMHSGVQLSDLAVSEMRPVHAGLRPHRWAAGNNRHCCC